MYAKYILLLIVLLAPTNLSASSWLVPIKDEVTITSYIQEPYGTVKVAAKLSANRKKLKYIKLVIHGKEIVFPDKSYSAIVYPDIGSMALHYDPSDKTKLFLYLEYSSGLDDPEQYNFVRFVIEDDKLVGRIFEELDKSDPRNRIMRYEDL